MEREGFFKWFFKSKGFKYIVTPLAIAGIIQGIITKDYIMVIIIYPAMIFYAIPCFFWYRWLFGKK